MEHVREGRESQGETAQALPRDTEVAPGGAGGAGGAGLLALQRTAGNQATTRLIQRRFLRSPGAAAPDRYGFEVGREVTPELATAALAATAGGPLDRAAIRRLADAERQRTGMVGESARLFLVGLMRPPNVALFRTGMASPARAFAFPLDSISSSEVARFDSHPNLVPRDVRRGEQEAERLRAAGDAAGASAALHAADEGAVRTLRSLAGARRGDMEAILAEARRHGIAGRSILRAMQSAAMEPNLDDRIAAAIAYTVCASAGMPVAPRLESGTIRVDAVEVPLLQAAGTAAVYCYGAMAYGGLDHGNTIFLPKTIQIGNAAVRGAIVHELTHAVQDQREAGRAFSWNDAEAEAYRTQARYLLDEVRARTGTEQANTALQVSNFVSAAVVGALVVVTAEDRARYEAALTLIRTQSPVPALHQDAAAVRASLDRPIAQIRADFQQAVAAAVSGMGQSASVGPAVGGYGDSSLTSQSGGFAP